MSKCENIRDIRNYVSGNAPEKKFMAYLSPNSRGILEANFSSEFTAVIKEAARCNRWASDCIYDIQEVERVLEAFNPDEFPVDGSNDDALPIVAMGFRKDGVDGNSFILSRCAGECYKVYSNYFALIFMEVKRGGNYADDWRMETTVYHV